MAGETGIERRRRFKTFRPNANAAIRIAALAKLGTDRKSERAVESVAGVSQNRLVGRQLRFVMRAILDQVNDLRFELPFAL